MLEKITADAAADRCQPDMPSETAHMCLCLIYVSSREPSVAVRELDTQACVGVDDW